MRGVGVRRIATICALVVVFAFVVQAFAGIIGPVSSKPPSKTTFSGTVQEVLNSPVVKIAGARVDIIELARFEITDSNGNFAISNVPVGTYTIVCSCMGYDTRTYENQYISSTSNYLTVELSPTPTRPEWLYMLYIDADSDEENFALNEAVTLTAAGTGPTDEVKVVYVVDRMSNWPDAANANARYYEIENHTPILLQDIGEANMGDPSTLSDFMIWAETNYPSLKTALIIEHMHGNAWMSGMTGDMTVPEQPGCTDVMTVEEVQLALTTTMNSTGIQLDLLNMMVCLMQMVEVDYELRGLVKTIVDAAGPTLYQACDDYISDLIADPSMDAASLGTVMVNDYALGDPMTGFTMSAIDMAGIGCLVSDTNLFADYLSRYLPTSRSQIVACRDTVQEYSPREWNLDHDYIDIYDFVDLVNARLISQDPGFLTVIESIRSDLESVVTANAADDVAVANSHGLGIYFPRERLDYYAQVSPYLALDFSAIGAPSWAGFLWDFFEVHNPVADFTYSVDHDVVSFDASSSWAQDGTIDGYYWDFGDGTTGDGSQPTHTYDSEGAYTVALNVVDVGLWSDPVTTTVYNPGPNIPPMVAMTYEAVDLTVTFYDASSDPDGYIAVVCWDFGDGSVLELGSPITHTYAQPGTYGVFHLVGDEDSDGAEETVNIMVAFNSPPSAPGVPMITPGDELDGTFELRWSASIDNDAFPIGGYWLMENACVDGVWSGWQNVSTNIPGTSITLTRPAGSYNYAVCAFDTAHPSLWSCWTDSPVWSPIIVPVTDSDPPVTSETSAGDLGDNGWYTSMVSVTLSISDASPIETTFYGIDSPSLWTTYTGAFSISDDGKHIVYFYSVDIRGNVEDTKSVMVWVDLTEPTTTATVKVTSAATVTLKASDSTSGVAAIYYSLNMGVTWLTYAGPFKVTGKGAHTVYYYSVDNAGNEEIARPMSFTI